MIHPERDLAGGSAAGGGSGTLSEMAATAATGAGSGFTAASSRMFSADGVGVSGAIAGTCPLFTVLMVVIAVRADSAGIGVSCRASMGNGDNAAVRIVPGWTATVFTALGLIGSVEPGSGASEDDRATDATRMGAEPVWSSSFSRFLRSLRACAISHPSTIGGAVRFTAAMLMLLSI